MFLLNKIHHCWSHELPKASPLAAFLKGHYILHTELYKFAIIIWRELPAAIRELCFVVITKLHRSSHSITKEICKFTSFRYWGLFSLVLLSRILCHNNLKSTNNDKAILWHLHDFKSVRSITHRVMYLERIGTSHIFTNKKSITLTRFNQCFRLQFLL